MGLKSLLRPIYHKYKNSYFKWYYVDNFSSMAKYKLNGHKLTPAGKKVLEELKQNGICITSVKELFGSEEILDKIIAEVKRIEAEKAAQINEQRKHVGEVADEKTFLFWVLGDTCPLDPDSPFGEFSLSPEVRQVVNGYYGLFPQLRFYNVWRNFKSNAPAMRSQLWHRDREDKGIMKVFLYLEDVDEGAGPFTYAPGTHLHGDIKIDPPSFKEGEGRNNPRSTDEQMATVVPKDKWIVGTGKRGAVIFADTAGYHKGGLARERDRLLFNLLYVSPASRAKVTFTELKKGYTPADTETKLALGAVLK
jgi:hypothetical protein